MTNAPIPQGLAPQCAEQPPAPLLRAIVEFNAGQFYACHDTLEALWRTETRGVRELYQGLLNVAVGCYHAQQGNALGAVGQLRKGIVRLERMPAVCQTVHVAGLRTAAGDYCDAMAAGRPHTAVPTLEVA